MTIVTFRSWTLTVDYKITKATYASVFNGGAEDCKCFDCVNYIANRNKVFPDEIKLLFDQLGVDYRKESEIWRMCKHNNGMHIYSGFFHFRGSFAGKDCFVSLNGKNGTFSMTDINESFSIGFRIASDLAYFKDNKTLVQVEFEVKVPWMIDKKLESDW